jgi:hypothetical protein
MPKSMSGFEMRLIFLEQSQVRDFDFKVRSNRPVAATVHAMAGIACKVVCLNPFPQPRPKFRLPRRKTAEAYARSVSQALIV